MADSITGVRRIDDHTLEVSLIAPVQYFFHKLEDPVSWIVDRESVDLLNLQLHPIGTGPFRQVPHIYDRQFILERNPFFESPVTALHHFGLELCWLAAHALSIHSRQLRGHEIIASERASRWILSERLKSMGLS